MSSETDNVRDSFAAQLASFDDKLHSTNDDVEMLADIQEGIANLLASTGENEADIRRILQERYEAGALRQETFQLIKSMLNRYITPDLPPRRRGKRVNEKAEEKKKKKKEGEKTAEDAEGVARQPSYRLIS